MLMLLSLTGQQKTDKLTDVATRLKDLIHALTGHQYAH